MSLGSYPRDWPEDLSARESDPFVRAAREVSLSNEQPTPPDSRSTPTLTTRSLRSSVSSRLEAA
jgi:hypothetical protein